MKRVLGLASLAPLAVIVVFFGLGLYSGTGKAPGLMNGQLAPCSSKPNCVSSEASPSDSHSVAALETDAGSSEEPFAKLRELLKRMGAEVVYFDDHYLASTFTSGFFHFVDDVEFRIDQGSKLIHVRSASRVGYSDLGANRARVESIRQSLKTMN